MNQYYDPTYLSYPKAPLESPNTPQKQFKDYQNAQITLDKTSGSLELNSYIRPSNKQVYSLIWEFFNPITQVCLFRLEKVLPVIQHFKNNNQILFWNMININNEMLQPNIILLPCSELRCVMTFYPSQSVEAPSQFEFKIDLEQYKSYQQQLQITPPDSTINFSVSIIDNNSEICQQLNYKLDSVLKRQSITSQNDINKKPPPGFGTQNNAYYVWLKNLFVQIPIKNSIQPKFGSSAKQQQQQQQQLQDLPSPLRTSPTTASSQKKKPKKLNINSPYFQNNAQLTSPLIKPPASPARIQQQTIIPNTIPSVSSSMQSSPLIPKNQMASYETPPPLLQIDDGFEEAILEQFNNFENLSYELIKGKIAIFAKKNQGSRILQKFIGKITSQELEQFISEISDSLADLMLDQYGNYMFQSLINACTVEQRYQILENIAPKMAEISKDKKGTHSLQTLVSLISFEKEINLIVESIKNCIKELSLNQNATHFLQKIILCFDEKYLGLIFSNIENNFVDYANHSCGLCLLKTMMNKSKLNSYNWRERLINLLTFNCDVLIQNPYGNYAIQHAFDIYGYDNCQAIAQRILQKLIQFSSQKYSSNVIDKLVSQFSNEFMNNFLQETIANDQIREFMKNKYGSLIIQKVLTIVDEYNFNIIIETIRKNLVHVHAANFKQKWQNIIEKSADSYPITSPLLSPYFNQNSPQLPLRMSPIHQPLLQQQQQQQQLMANINLMGSPNQINQIPFQQF